MPTKRSLRSPRFNVTVTSEQIDYAIPRDSAHCMIAEALRQAYPTALYVDVDLQTIRFSDPAKRLRFIYLTPRPAQIALIDFDQGRRPEPFVFTLNAGQSLAMTSGKEEHKPTPARSSSALTKFRKDVCDAIPKTGIPLDELKDTLNNNGYTFKKAATLHRRLQALHFTYLIELRSDRRYYRKTIVTPPVPDKPQLADPARERHRGITGIIGGKAPPKSIYARRRGFGLRNFGAY